MGRSTSIVKGRSRRPPACRFAARSGSNRSRPPRCSRQRSRKACADDSARTAARRRSASAALLVPDPMGAIFIVRRYSRMEYRARSVLPRLLPPPCAQRARIIRPRCARPALQLPTVDPRAFRHWPSNVGARGDNPLGQSAEQSKELFAHYGYTLDLTGRPRTTLFPVPSRSARALRIFTHGHDRNVALAGHPGALHVNGLGLEGTRLSIGGEVLVARRRRRRAGVKDLFPPMAAADVLIHSSLWWTTRGLLRAWGSCKISSICCSRSEIGNRCRFSSSIRADANLGRV